MIAINSPAGRHDNFKLIEHGLPELTMATIRNGPKSFVHWFNNFRLVNRPRYRWYEHDLY